MKDHHLKTLTFTLLTWLMLGCQHLPEKPTRRANPQDFGTAFFEALTSQKDLSPYFITLAEIHQLYDTLEVVTAKNHLQNRDLAFEKKYALQNLKNAQSLWQNNYQNLADALLQKKLTLDSLQFDYVIARMGQEIIIPYPVSLTHQPDLSASHYAKITYFLSNHQGGYTLEVLPFFDGNSWVFDMVSDYEPLLKPR